MANLYELLTPLITCNTVQVKGTSNENHIDTQQPKEKTTEPSKKTKTLPKQSKVKKHTKTIKKRLIKECYKK